MPKRKASYPWDYFDDLENNRVRCRICSIEFNKKTSNQQNHLKRHHLINRPEIIKPVMNSGTSTTNGGGEMASNLFTLASNLPTIIRPRITKIVDPPRLTKAINFTTHPTTNGANPTATNSNAFVYNLMYHIQQKATADYHANSSTSNSLCQQLSSESSFHDTNDENLDDDDDENQYEQLEYEKSQQDSLGGDECVLEYKHQEEDDDQHSHQEYHDDINFNQMNDVIYKFFIFKIYR